MQGLSEMSDKGYSSTPEPEPIKVKKYRFECGSKDSDTGKRKRSRSSIVRTEAVSVPFPGYYSDSDMRPVNLTRGRRRVRRRCYTPGSFVGEPDFGDLSPIGSEREIRSYTSSRASSVIICTMDSNDDVNALPADVFHDDEESRKLLDKRLSLKILLSDNLVGHLLPKFEAARYEIEDIFKMTNHHFRQLGISGRRDIALVKLLIMTYSNRKPETF